MACCCPSQLLDGESYSVLVYLRPTRLIYVREKGPYELAIPRAWERLFAWLTENGHYATFGRGYGLARDDPEEVGAHNCRYDAAVEVPAALRSGSIRNLGFATLPGGPYARRRVAGSYDRLRSLVANIYTEFVPFTGLSFDRRRPVISIYVDNPDRHAENDLRADICVPVMTEEDIRRPKIVETA